MHDTPRDGDVERLSCVECGAEIRPQSDREIAEMIAKFRTPPRFSWEDLANDIEFVLGMRSREIDARDAALREARAEIERLRLDCQDLESANIALAEADEEIARLRADAKPEGWRPDRTGWYWVRYPKAQIPDWAHPAQWIAGENGLEGFWVNGPIRRDGSVEVGPYIPPPPSAIQEDGK